MHKAFMNWSGGKDSALALYRTIQQRQYKVEQLLTNVNAVHNRISMHGVRRELLSAQAQSIGIPFTTIELPEEPAMHEYENVMERKLYELKRQQFTHSVFGDIFLEDLKQYREEKLNAVGMQAVFPLWKEDTKQLMKEFLSLGFKTIIVCVNEKYLSKSFCGRVLDEECISALPAAVDVCGENGEFHTFVFDGPLFKQPVSFATGELVYKEYAAPAGEAVEKYGFWFCDLLKA